MVLTKKYCERLCKNNGYNRRGGSKRQSTAFLFRESEANREGERVSTRLYPEIAFNISWMFDPKERFGIHSRNTRFVIPIRRVLGSVRGKAVVGLVPSSESRVLCRDDARYVLRCFCLSRERS